MNRMLPVLVVALAVVFGASQAPARPQSQAGPTTGTEMMPPFDPRYFLGVWEVEWSPPDLGLIPGGAYTGTETVTHLRNRYLKVVVALEHEDGTQLNGEGVMFYEYGLNGQSLVRYVAYDAGFSVLQSGAHRRRSGRLLQLLLGHPGDHRERPDVRPQGTKLLRVARRLSGQSGDLAGRGRLLQLRDHVASEGR